MRQSLTMTAVRTVTVAVAVLTASGTWAAPGHDDGHGQEFVGGHPGKPSEVDRTVEITAADIHFDRERLEVVTGETVRFVVTNTGKIRHDFTLGPPGVQHAHRQEMAELMKDGTMHDHDDPNAVMLAPGETKEVIWTFEEADEFLFGCNVPGHFEAGMKGEIAIDARLRDETGHEPAAKHGS